VPLLRIGDAPPDAAADDRIPAPDTPMAASIDRSIRAPAFRRPIVAPTAVATVHLHFFLVA